MSGPSTSSPSPVSGQADAPQAGLEAGLEARPCGPLSGRVRVPGDKSISHRALMLGALASGETRIEGLLEGEDVLCTGAAMAALGARIHRQEPAAGHTALWTVSGAGVGSLIEPDDVLDMGNAGTGVRLLMGLVATHPLYAVFTGDASLRRRPMGRVAIPLRQMGAQFLGRAGERLPMTVIGTENALPLTYALPVPSAQVKSAILLAGLNTPGETSVIETAPSRDHTELMLRHFGARLRVEDITHDGASAQKITLCGPAELEGRPILVPSDPSSAAFPMVAALLRPGSEIVLTDVGLNPRRTGLFATLREMGAEIAVENRREEAGEPIGDLRVIASRLRGVEVPASRAPSMIDEYPVLAMAAACAEGTTVMHGLAELRVKESDRLSAITRGLEACGVSVRVEGDSLAVTGNASPPRGGAVIETGLDHRIAMAFLVLGLAAQAPIRIDDAEPITTSFPDFDGLMRGLGADIRPLAEA